MNRQRKIFFRLSIMAASLIVCISLIALISSRLIEKEAVKEKILSVISQKLGGKVSFQSSGESVTDFGKTENISIKGRLQNGELFVPDNQLTFRAVNGEFVIRKGILEGRNIESTLGNAVLQKGELKFGRHHGEDTDSAGENI